MTSQIATLNTSETTVPHTRLIKCGLAAEDSAVFWQHAKDLNQQDAVQVAAARYWFGAKSERRLRDLLGCLRLRFLPFPAALMVLARWRPGPRDRALICHWHVQLTDPTYRAFASDFLVTRREAAQPVTHRHAVQWVQDAAPEPWSATTRRDMAGRLLSTAANAGILRGRHGTRQPMLPPVTDAALGYILHLLRDVQIEADLVTNPYLRSVGLDGRALDARLRTLSGLDFRRVADVTALEWHHDSLMSWANATVLPGAEHSA
jgi:hypothetical protein